MKPEQHRVLLIEPPFYRLYKNTYSLDRYPLSLGYLAGTIRNETDWNVLVYNADFHFQGESQSVSYMAGAGFSNYLNNLKDYKKYPRNAFKYIFTIRGCPYNCFCINIPHERFRKLVSKIEKMVDRRNSLNRIKRVFYLTTFRRIQELGIGESFKKGARIFMGR